MKENMRKRLNIVGFLVLCIFALIGILALFGVLPQRDVPIEKVVEEPKPPIETADEVVVTRDDIVNILDLVIIVEELGG